MTRYRDPFDEPYNRERPSRSDALNSNRIDAETPVIQSHAQPLRTSMTQRTGAIATPVDRSLGDRHVIRHDSADYNAGFIQGRAIEHHRMMETQRARDEENTINGLLAGILLTSLIALGIGTAYFLSQRNNTPRTIERTIVVPSPVPTTAPVQVVPVPQPTTPVNITVPQQPQPQQPQPQQPQPQQSVAPEVQPQAQPQGRSIAPAPANTGSTTQQTAPTAVQPTTPTGVQPTAPVSPATTNPSGTTTTAPTTGTQPSGAARTGAP